MENTEKKRKTNCLSWALKARRFNKERKRLIEYYRIEREDFWVEMLEKIYIPVFDWEYITAPDEMPANFFVPNVLSYKDGSKINSYECKASSLGYLMQLFLKLSGKETPREICELLELLG